MMLAGWLGGEVKVGLDGRVGRLWTVLVGARVGAVAMGVEMVDEEVL